MHSYTQAQVCTVNAHTCTGMHVVYVTLDTLFEPSKHAHLHAHVNMHTYTHTGICARTNMHIHADKEHTLTTTESSSFSTFRYRSLAESLEIGLNL